MLGVSQIGEMREERAIGSSNSRFLEQVPSSAIPGLGMLFSLQESLKARREGGGESLACQAGFLIPQSRAEQAGSSCDSAPSDAAVPCLPPHPACCRSRAMIPAGFSSPPNEPIC